MDDTTRDATAQHDEAFPLGAHIVSPRRWYVHHGIYVGGGQVVHYEGLSSSLRRGPITKVTLAEFSQGHPVRQQLDDGATYSGIDVVERACSRLGEDAYDVLRNNCEHICSWCRAGASRSPQVEQLRSVVALVAFALTSLTSLLGAATSAHDALPVLH
jgi:hypothetical protein